MWTLCEAIYHGQHEHGCEQRHDIGVTVAYSVCEATPDGSQSGKEDASYKVLDVTSYSKCCQWVWPDWHMGKRNMMEFSDIAKNLECVSKRTNTFSNLLRI